MEKRIATLSRDPHAIGLADRACSLFIAPKSGCIFMDEGDGEGRINGVVFTPANNPTFIVQASKEAEHVLLLEYCGIQHTIGTSENRDDLDRWAQSANSLLTEKRAEPVTTVNKSVLVERIKARDKDAVRELIVTHKEEVCRVIRTILRGFSSMPRGQATSGQTFRSQIESVFNETLTRLVRHVQTGSATIEDSALVPYMVAVARNLLLNRKRKAARGRSVGDEPLAQLNDPGPSASEVAEDREMAAKYRTILAGMPERCRMLIELRLDEGLGYAEIGELLNMNPHSVRARYAECLAELRRLGEAGSTRGEYRE